MIAPSSLSSMVMILDNIVPQSKELMCPINNTTKSTTWPPLILQAGERPSTLPLDRALIVKTGSRTKDFNEQQVYALVMRFCPHIPPYT